MFFIADGSIKRQFEIPEDLSIASLAIAFEFDVDRFLQSPNPADLSQGLSQFLCSP
ncbi:MAG: hypothetical protein VKL39_12005 [Leptolyngbyaceae bacterium]|nr:hypothetical protein [Leptolyngbyaceae bacterium]